ncbi:thioredoxin reductase 1, cytoplasmic-like [Schistocerca nitens]|uniref:thioredoxin reductase 1, cytoplasmic-like n=1 Tax=Schistocerca nitens TaxID=7011 RepID=UPI00211990E1|nr:thioredoxin reductase 1, cytoplasmic-like [Schistocerca nitens]
MKIFSVLFKQITTIMEKLSGESLVDYIINSNKVTIFSKTTCPFCKQVKSLMESLSEPYFAFELDQTQDGPALQNILAEKTQQRTVPNVFIRGMHVGGCSDVLTAYRTGALRDMLDGTYEKCEYDLVVIGGGSGGIAAAKEAAALGRKVAVCDFVKPSPMGTTWGLGGTCVNVGCIPKKLMHRAALLGHDIKEGPAFGWRVSTDITHDWAKLVEEVQNYIKSLNFNYRKELRTNKITYHNAFAEFEDAHRIKMRNIKNEVSTLTAQNFVIAVGGRPHYPNIPGAKEYAITSDDIFSLKYNPGKTVIVGASYIALECAGFLAGFGLDATVLVRSILLRGFDQQMAEMIGSHMESQGVKFIRGCVPTGIEKIEDGAPPVLKVHAVKGEKRELVEIVCNTVLFATGRNACTSNMGLDKIGIALNKSNGKIVVDEYERTSVNNIFAIGDVIDGKPELTPVAIQAGKLLSRRLFSGEMTKMDYTFVPTTVFTPLEYGCVGFSEEHAIDEYDKENIEVYHTHFNAVENALSNRDEGKPYIKIICLKSDENRIIGFHILGPNAGEITQGFGLGLKLGAKLKDLHNLVGIHPTCAEVATTLSITKSSGKSVDKTSC